MPTLDDWQEKGFAESPRCIIARGSEIVYRYGGGPTSGVLGRWFGPVKCDMVSQAELKYNMAIRSNKLCYVATFKVRTGTKMWVRGVAHNKQDLADFSAVQIYIEHPLGSVTLVRDVESIRQDLMVSRRSGHV